MECGGLRTQSYLIGNCKDKHWKMYYYSYFAQDEPTFTSTNGFGRTWLNENLGVIILSYERKDRMQQPNRKLILDRFLYLANIKPNNMVKLYQPYLDLTDVAIREGMDVIPYNVSGNLVLNFDGALYPLSQRTPIVGSWIWKYLCINDDKQTKDNKDNKIKKDNKYVKIEKSDKVKNKIKRSNKTNYKNGTKDNTCLSTSVLVDELDL